MHRSAGALQARATIIDSCWPISRIPLKLHYIEKCAICPQTTFWWQLFSLTFTASHLQISKSNKMFEVKGTRKNKGALHVSLFAICSMGYSKALQFQSNNMIIRKWRGLRVSHASCLHFQSGLFQAKAQLEARKSSHRPFWYSLCSIFLQTSPHPRRRPVSGLDGSEKKLPACVWDDSVFRS